MVWASGSEAHPLGGEPSRNDVDNGDDDLLRISSTEGEGLRTGEGGCSPAAMVCSVPASVAVRVPTSTATVTGPPSAGIANGCGLERSRQRSD